MYNCNMNKKALVLGAGGFIGSHMVKRLKSEGYWVKGVDLKYPEFSKILSDEFKIGDLTDQNFVENLISQEIFDEIYQFAADMGGAGYIFTGEHDADLMTNSAKINLNLLNSISKINLMNNINKTKIFYSSSACIYPEYNQMDASSLNCEESSAYPAAPYSEYGWEKLFSERLYLAYSKNHKIPIAIARYHNIFGPESTFTGGREKSPAAICRKIIETSGKIEIWGDGQQTRSFLYIDECIEGTRRLMSSNYQEPVNIGSDEMISINELVNMISSYSNKEIIIEHIDGPTGVRCRNSDNKLIYSKIGWKPTMGLEEGIKKTYDWIKNVYSKTS